jgi:hypothetical protein
VASFPQIRGPQVRRFASLSVPGEKRMKNPAMEGELYLIAAWFAIMMLVRVIIDIRIFAELIGYMALAMGLIVYNRHFAVSSLAV